MGKMSAASSAGYFRILMFVWVLNDVCPPRKLETHRLLLILTEGKIEKVGKHVTINPSI
jgi:hypothetical protein